MTVVYFGCERTFPFALLAVNNIDSVIHLVDIFLAFVSLSSLSEDFGGVTGIAEVLIY